MNERASLAGVLDVRLDAMRPVVCVQGLGFVGCAMAVAVASARSGDEPLYAVIGVDLPNSIGRHRVESIARGEMPFAGADDALTLALVSAHNAGNLSATVDPEVFRLADIVFINLDLGRTLPEPDLCFEPLLSAIDDLGQRLRPGALIIIESTVPPGTCERVIAPRLSKCLQARGLSGDAVLLAHSYERVMPGAQYYTSIVNYCRVYAGMTPAAANTCERFLSTVVNVAEYPLTRLASKTASETAKVLENSYRAVTIAFMEEWGRFAEAVGIDLFQVIEAVRKRPTHANMRQPGFGVGGLLSHQGPSVRRSGGTADI